MAVAGGTLVLEAFVALALWSQRLRPVALTAATAFHVSILLLMEPADQLLVFALIMASAYLTFLVDPIPTLPQQTALVEVTG